MNIWSKLFKDNIFTLENLMQSYYTFFMKIKLHLKNPCPTR